MALLREMKAGKFAEGEVNLRLKMDLYHDDGAMWDTCTLRTVSSSVMCSVLRMLRQS